MNREALVTELNGLLMTETHSLLHHLDEARPYLTSKTYRAWSDIKSLAQTSRRHAQQLSALLPRFDIPERPGTHSSEVARFHFVTLDSLLPELTEEKQKQIASYRRTLKHADHDAQLHRTLVDFLGDNEDQIEHLQAIQASLRGQQVVAG